MCHDARRSCGDESFVSWEGQEKDLSTSLTVRWSRKRKRWESDNAVFWNDRKTKWSCRSEDGNISIRRRETHVHLDGRQCGLPNDSTIMLEQLRTLDKQRLLGYIGSIGKAKMKEVDQALEISVGTSKKPLPP